jgi:hypothetical protein
VGIDRVFCCQGYSLRYVEHNPWLGTRGKWMDIYIIYKAFPAAGDACMNHAQAAHQLSCQNRTLTAQLCLKSDWSTAQSLFHPSMVHYMTIYHLNHSFNHWSSNPADNAATQFAARICYILRNLTVTKSTEDVCLSIPGYPTLRLVDRSLKSQ